MRRHAHGWLIVLTLATLLAGCSRAGPSTSVPPSLGADPDAARLRAQAAAALARWAEAVTQAHGSTAFVPVWELTGMIGVWEEAVGENNKVALYAGLVEAAAPVPSDQPADGRIQWPDGTSTGVSLISASQALADIRADAVQPCPDCRPLRVSDPRLMQQPFETSRGRALVPMWTFAVEGSAARITRVAIASRVSPVPPPWDANDPPIGVSIDGATIAADGLTLTVGFVGAGSPASEPCGEDYRGEAVESDLAVVAIVHIVRNLTPAACDAVGHARTAALHLANPLGERAVLEVREGRPVPVSRG